MRKQEYIHLHALLKTISQHLIVHEGMPPEQITAYQHLTVRPTSVQKSKQQHHQAVMALVTAIGSWVEESPRTEEDVPVP